MIDCDDAEWISVAEGERSVSTSMSIFLGVIFVLIIGVFVWHGCLSSGAVGKTTKGRTSATRNLVLLGGVGPLLLIQLFTPRAAGRWIFLVGFGVVYAVFIVMVVQDIRRRRTRAQLRGDDGVIPEVGGSRSADHE